MKSFEYYDNSKQPPVLVASYEEESISDADKKLEADTGINPIKASHIGCRVSPKKE